MLYVDLYDHTFYWHDGSLIINGTNPYFPTNSTLWEERLAKKGNISGPAPYLKSYHKQWELMNGLRGRIFIEYNYIINKTIIGGDELGIIDSFLKDFNVSKKHIEHSFPAGTGKLVYQLNKITNKWRVKPLCINLEKGKLYYINKYKRFGTYYFEHYINELKHETVSPFDVLVGKVLDEIIPTIDHEDDWFVKVLIGKTIYNLRIQDIKNKAM